MTTDDPYHRHPRLRSLIRAPETSFFRGFRPSSMIETLIKNGLPRDWLCPDATLEAARQAAFADFEGDLWVFGYGSLMWDPAIHFAEVRRAQVVGYTRKFCLVDRMGERGTPQAPGIMAGLDTGAHCDGLAFRIRAADIARETPDIWNREMCIPAYRPACVPADTAHGAIKVLTFVADRSSSIIDANLPRADQIRFAATGAGFLGTSLDYLVNLAAHFDAMNIGDPNLTDLLAEARAYQAKTVPNQDP